MNQGVFSVVGMPYSGSTLLSFILGSHSQVYNGADLHHLNPDRKGQCSIHKTKCPIFTEQALDDIYSSFGHCDEWYDKISYYSNSPFIVDASKRLGFFEQTLRKTQKNTVVIALNKHPMRALASDLYNRLFDRKLKITDLARIEKYKKENQQEIQDFLVNRMNTLLTDVKNRKQLLEEVAERENIQDIVYLKYEEYIKRPHKIFSNLLNKFQLDYDKNFTNYHEYEHHPITGNIAPVWKLRNTNKNYKDNNDNFRKNFYLKNSSSIVADNKFRQLLSNDEINWIQSQPQYHELLQILDYRPMDEKSSNDNFVKYKSWTEIERNTHISLSHKYIYFQVSKSASSTVKYYLQLAELKGTPWEGKVANVNKKYMSPHLSPFQLPHNRFKKILKSDNFKKITFVRNPYTRLLSCYLHRIIGQPKSRSAKQLTAQMNRTDITDITFEEFIKFICQQQSKEMESHWRVQYDEVLGGEVKFDFIGKQENLTDDIKSLLKYLYGSNEYINVDNSTNESPQSTSASDKLNKYYTNELIDLVRTRYQNDFEYFGYSLELPVNRSERR